MASSLQTLLDTGSQMLRSQQFADAQNVAATLLQQYPGNPLALLFAADTADAQGNTTDALRHLEAVPPGSPHHAQVALRNRNFCSDCTVARKLATLRCPWPRGSRIRRRSRHSRKC